MQNWHKALITVAAIVIALVLFRLLTPEEEQRAAPTKPSASVTEPGRSPTVRRVRGGQSPDMYRPVARRQTLLRETTTSPAEQMQPEELSGYLYDNFIDLTELPPGYLAEAIAIGEDGLSLAVSGIEDAPRTGQIESPPLPLQFPSQPLASLSRISVPEGTQIDLEVSLSHDGKDWSPWHLAQRFRPDVTERRTGHDAALGMTPAREYVSEETPMGADPQIRYRLTLSSETTASPTVADIRIWRRTP